MPSSYMSVQKNHTVDITVSFSIMKIPAVRHIITVRNLRYLLVTLSVCVLYWLSELLSILLSPLSCGFVSRFQTDPNPPSVPRYCIQFRSTMIRLVFFLVFPFYFLFLFFSFISFSPCFPRFPIFPVSVYLPCFSFSFLFAKLFLFYSFFPLTFFLPCFSFFFFSCLFSLFKLAFYPF